MSTESRKPGRGPYRIGDVSTGNKDADLLRDPQVAAFAAAVAQIKDPRSRAIVEWLVRELARSSIKPKQHAPE